MTKNLLHAEANTNDLGIGTNDPEARLHIESTGSGVVPQLLLEEKGGPSDAAILQFRNADQSGHWSILGLPGGTEGTLRFFTNLGSSLMTLKGTGKVGMGTDDPTGRLHVQSNGSSSSPQLVLFESSATDYARLNFQNESGGSRWSISGKTNNTGADAELNFYNSVFGGNVMSLQGDGKVSIGTTNPAARLHIRSNGSGSDPQLLLYEDSSTDYARLNFENNSGSTRWTISGKTSNTNADAELNFYNSGLGDDVMSLQGDGQVGVGTTNPSDRFQVSADAGEDAFRVQVGGATKFRIYENGGINLFSNSMPDSNELRIELGPTDIKFIPGSQPYIRPTVSGQGFLGSVSQTWNVVYSAFFNGILTVPSDVRYKENIEPLNAPFDKLGSLKPTSYALRREFFYDQRGYSTDEIKRTRQYGLIAQEVEATMPEIVHTDDEGFKTVNYTALIPILVEAVNQLKEENEQLKLRLDELEANQ